MDPKTAKQEAMSLLAKDNLTAKEAARLERLTAQQAKIKLMYQVEWFSFVNNVDDCLTLFPADEYVVFMQRNPNHCVCSVRPLEDILFTAAKEEAKTLPLAMLKAWWQMQD